MLDCAVKSVAALQVIRGARVFAGFEYASAFSFGLLNLFGGAWRLNRWRCCLLASYAGTVVVCDAEGSRLGSLWGASDLQQHGGQCGGHDESSHSQAAWPAVAGRRRRSVRLVAEAVMPALRPVVGRLSLSRWGDFRVPCISRVSLP